MATAKQTETVLDVNSDDTRERNYARKAAMYAISLACWTHREASEGDIVEIPDLTRPGRTNLAVVLTRPQWGEFQGLSVPLQSGSAIIVRNSHDDAKYSEAESRKLANKLSAALKAIAHPAGAQTEAFPAWGKDTYGYPVDRPETGIILPFFYPELSDENEPITLAPFREGKASKASEPEPAKQASKALAETTANAKPAKPGKASKQAAKPAAARIKPGQAAARTGGAPLRKPKKT